MERRGVNGVTGDMLTPVVKRHAPWIGAEISAKTGQSLISGLKTKPTAITLPDWTIRGFNLGMMEHGLPKDQVTVRGPRKIVEGMVTVFGTEPCEHPLPKIGSAITIRIFEECQVWHFGHVHSPIAKFERKRNVQVIGKDR